MSEDNVVPLSPPNVGGTTTGGNGYGERLAKIEAVIGFMATREDVERVRTDIAHIRADMADIRTLIERKETSRLRWLIGLLVSIAIATTTLAVRMFA